ncbi:hypothetical protein D3C83_139860 [compost metagenome]
MNQARRQGCFLAEVAAQVEHPYAPVGLLEGQQAGQCRVGAAVVDENELEADRLVAKHGLDPLQKGQQGFLFVVDGNNE